MTDNEIIKALECCHMDSDFPNCNECPIRNTCNNVLLIDEVFSLINRQKAEIERLQDYNENLQTANTALSNEILEAKSEAIREFAERLKENLTGIGRSTTYGNFEYGTVKSYEIDNLVKEMMEVQK